MIQRRIFVLLLTVLFALPALYGSAQTPVADGFPGEDELDGLTNTVWRSYAPARAFGGEGIISDATPVSASAGVSAIRSISVVVRAFETAEQAAEASEQITAGAESSLLTVFRDGSQTIVSENLSDIGSKATLIRSDYAGQGSDVWLEYVIVQRDQYVIFVSADGSVLRNAPGRDAVHTSLPTVGIATAIAKEGNPSPDAMTFMEDGMSSGGLWGFMLPADDPLLMGLVPTQDSILYPIPSS